VSSLAQFVASQGQLVSQVLRSIVVFFVCQLEVIREFGDFRGVGLLAHHVHEAEHPIEEAESDQSNEEMAVADLVYEPHNSASFPPAWSSTPSCGLETLIARTTPVGAFMSQSCSLLRTISRNRPSGSRSILPVS